MEVGGGGRRGGGGEGGGGGGGGRGGEGEKEGESLPKLSAKRKTHHYGVQLLFPNRPSGGGPNRSSLSGRLDTGASETAKVC